MPTQLTTEAPAYQCRHIFTAGHRCGSRALRHEHFCFYHHGTRKPASGPRLAVAPEVPDPTSAFDLPLPEDRAAIQQSIGLILQRIARNQLDPRRAGLLLYALQIASSNLPKADKNAQPPETVEEITFDELHGPLAPQAELTKAKGEKSLEQILNEQWNEPDPTLEPKGPETLDLQAAAQQTHVVCPTPTTVPLSLGWASAAGRPNQARRQTQPSRRPTPPAQTPRSSKLNANPDALKPSKPKPPAVPRSSPPPPAGPCRQSFPAALSPAHTAPG